MCYFTKREDLDKKRKEEKEKYRSFNGILKMRYRQLLKILDVEKGGYELHEKKKKLVCPIGLRSMIGTGWGSKE